MSTARGKMFQNVSFPQTLICIYKHKNKFPKDLVTTLARKKILAINCRKGSLLKHKRESWDR